VEESEATQLSLETLHDVIFGEDEDDEEEAEEADA
jgi:hypothetical protein